MSNHVDTRNNSRVYDNRADFDKVVKRVGQKNLDAGTYSIKEIDILRKNWRGDSTYYLRVHGVFAGEKFIGYAERMRNGNTRLIWTMQGMPTVTFEVV